MTGSDAPRPGYCACDLPVIDVDYDAGCRRCGLPVDFTPLEPPAGAWPMPLDQVDHA